MFDDSSSPSVSRAYRAEAMLARCSAVRGYSHVLIPIKLEPSERPVVSLALQVAAAWRARVTLLHVLPSVPAPNSYHWLDAIDALHRALAEPRTKTPPPLVTAVDKTRREIDDFIERNIDAEIRDSLSIETECRVGDAATEIVRFAEHQSVDLLILYRRRSTWRLPLWPCVARRVVRHTRKPVALLHPPAGARASLPDSDIVAGRA